MGRHAATLRILDAAVSAPCGYRRSVVFGAAPEADDEALDRIVSLLARGLERLLAGARIEQDGGQVERGLDFPPHQSVTTDDVLGSTEGYR